MIKQMTRLLLVVIVMVTSPVWGQEPPPAYPAPPVQPAPTPGYQGYGYGAPPPYLPRQPRRPYRETNPSAIYGELLGKGLAYSVGYDYAVRRFLAIGASVSYLDPAVFFSPYVNFYPVGSTRSALMLQAGLQIVNVDGSSNDFLQDLLWVEDGVDVGGQVSIGYEFRSAFLFRVALLGMFNRHGFLPWFGLTFGGSF
jgi:hypothetical protein